MLILFDHGTPKGLARALPGHTMITAQARGWDRLNNGLLLNAADEARLDLFLTTDRRIRYQQNLAAISNFRDSAQGLERLELQPILKPLLTPRQCSLRFPCMGDAATEPW